MQQLEIKKETQNKSRQKYYSDRFQPFFKENFESEKIHFNSILLEEYQTILASQDYEKIQFYIKPLIERITKIYGLSTKTKEQILLTTLNFLFEQQGINYILQNSVLDIVKFCLSSSQYHQYKIKIDWKVLYNFQENKFKKNDLKVPSPIGSKNAALFVYMRYIIMKLRKFFDDSSIPEIFSLFKEKMNPLDLTNSISIIYFYLKFDKKAPKQYYIQILDELIIFWGWKTFLGYDNFFFNMMVNLQRIPDLPWDKHLNFLYTQFQKQIIYLMPMESKQYQLSHLQWLPPGWCQQSSNKSCIAILMVGFMVPSNHQNYDLIWENTETIFRLIKNFLHPNNEGKHTIHILKFFNIFVQKYVERNVREKNIQKKLNQQQKKKEEEDDNNNSDEIEDIDQYNDFGQQEEQGGYSQPNEEENEENQNISDEEMPESYFQKNQDFIKLNLLDSVCHERFLNICLEYLEYMIYLKEQKSFITYTIKYLAYFQPDKIIPFILPKLYDTLTRSDMTYTTIIKILMILITPIMNRKSYKQGLYEIPNIIRNTQQQLNANDINLSYSIWKLYDRIFSYLPIQDPDDLIKSIKEKRPDLDDEGVRNVLNEGEDIDMLRFYEEYSEISKIVLKQFLNLFQYIEQKKQIEKNYRTSFISVHNKFWSFVFQASPSIFKETLQFVSSILGNQIQIQAQKQYSYLLQSFSLRDPYLSLQTFFYILYNQIVKKSKINIETLEKNPMFYIIKAQENNQLISSYTLEDLNEKSLLWYLDLIEDLLTFSGIFSKQFDKEIQIFIFQCFLHPEFSIFSKATKILHKIILSLISIYPMEIRCQSQSEQPHDPLYPFNYHKYLGEENHENFDIQWHSPTQEERDYALVWFNRIWGPIMTHFDSNYFKDEKIVISDRLEGLIDQMMQEKETENNSLKNEIQMSYYLLDQILGAVHLRMTSIEDKSNTIQKQFIENFKYQEFDHINQQLMKFISNSFSYLIKNNLIQNVKISLNLINLINMLLSIDEYNNKMLQMVKWLRNTRSVYRDPYSKWSNTPRFINIVVATVTFYTRIYSYTYNLPYGDKYDETKNQILFLIFHPYDKVQQAAELTLKQYCQSYGDREKLKHELLRDTFPIFENRLNKSSPNFFPKIMVQDKPNFSSLQVQFNRTISVLKMVLKISYQYFYQSIQDISRIQQLFEIIQSYDEIPNDITKKTLIQMIPMVFVIFLMTTKKLQQINNEQDQKLFLNHEKKQILEYKKIILYDYESTDQLIMQLEKFRQYCFEIVKDEQCNTRKKTVLSLAILLCSLQDQDPEGDIMTQNMEIFSQALLSNEYDIRNLGMYSVFSLLRVIKRAIKTSKVVECDGKESNPTSQLHFLKEDQMNSLKSGYFGFIQPLESIEVSEYDFSKLNKINQVFQNKIANQDFCLKLIEYLHNDINCAKESQKNQMSQMQQFMSNSNIFIYHYFNIDAKKDNLFKSHEISREFYIRYIKKLFQLCGYVFFLNTKDFVTKLVKSEKKEDQNFIHIYLSGLFKAIFTKINCNKDQLLEMQDYVFENVNKDIQNVSREQFQMWQVSLILILFSLNKNQMKLFINYLFKQKFAINKEDAKYNRFLWIIRMYIRFYGYQDQEVSNYMLQEILDREPSENKQILEYSRILLHIFIFTYNVPINMNLQNLKDHQDFVKYDDIYYVQRSDKLKEVFISISSKAQGGDKNTMKKYAELINKIFEIFIYEKMDENLFWYLEDVFVYYLEFKEEDIEDPVIIKALSINVLQLASLQYHKQIIDKVIKIVEKNLQNDNWRIKYRTLGFFQHFIYTNKFMIDPSYDFLSPVIELLNDKQQLVLNLAQNSLSDLLKITSPQQILKIIKVLRDKIQSQSQEDKVKGLQGYMSLLLHQPYEVMDWTEECLNQLLSHKKLANNVKVKLKEFASKFLKNNYQDSIKKDANLSENILIKLKEIANPYNYFA